MSTAAEPREKRVALEEDDEFDEFETENWGVEQQDDADMLQWQDDWDDDALDDDFTAQLRAQLERTK